MLWVRSQSGVIELIPLFHTDINECIEYEDYENPYTTNDVQVEHNHLCHARATCFNTIGSFHCKCKLGYHGDGKLCLSNKYRMVAALFRSKWQRAKVYRRFLVNVQVKQYSKRENSSFCQESRFRSRKAAWIRTKDRSFISINQK